MNNVTNAYLYKIEHKPTGLLYFGSRKTPEGISVSEDEYMGSPKGSNKMLELFKISDKSEFSKEILAVGLYEDIIEMEPLLIKEAWDKFGKESEGGLVCNLAVGLKVVMTEDVRAKLSASKTGVKTGPKSSVTKSRMSASQKGIPKSAESRAKMSAARMGKTPWNKGVKGGKMSAEQKAKIAASVKASWAKRKEAA